MEHHHFKNGYTITFIIHEACFLILDMKNLLPWFVLYSEPLAEPEFDWNWGILQIKEQRASQPSKNWMFSQKLSDKPILLKNNINTSLFKDSMDLHCLCSPFYCASSGDSSATLQRKGSRIARKFRLALYRGVSNGESKQHTWWVGSTHLKKLNQLGIIIPNSVYFFEKVYLKPSKQLNQNMSGGEPLSSGMLIRGDRINSRIQTATLPEV